MNTDTNTISLDRNSPVPVHRQVESHLREWIVAGEYAPGRMLPSVKVLCRRFGGINHLTVRQAIKSLASERLVESVPGRGVFVAKKGSRMRRVSLVLPNLEDEWTIRVA